MSILQCDKCKAFSQPDQPRAAGDKCECGGRFRRVVSELTPEEPPDTGTIPEQPEMFDQPPFNHRLYTRDQLRDMCEVASQKCKLAEDTLKKRVKEYQKLSLMLKSVEGLME